MCEDNDVVMLMEWNFSPSPFLPVPTKTKGTNVPLPGFLKHKGEAGMAAFHLMHALFKLSINVRDED